MAKDFANKSMLVATILFPSFEVLTTIMVLWLLITKEAFSEIPADIAAISFVFFVPPFILYIYRHKIRLKKQTESKKGNRNLYLIKGVR
ncbi:hypothetical protein P9126_10415 [Bacillus glycinifermentans]|uniref:hypothetical protein n=1 Tax=Bacillus glycinifermentans TaxID=1664069 RepID=UPI002DBD4413|nr:hypothetical protein [Bacillus glycinifermentans]MEC3607397.1 hypothetical protein [Bacillus glycinifermentans]